LHLLAKELLAGLDALMIPPYEFTRQRKTKAGTLIRHQATVAKGGRVAVHSVKIEESEEGFVPDIIIESGSKSLIVEVAVSSRVKRPKLRRIRKRDLPAIEIRLEPGDSLLSRDRLKTKLQCELASKVWLFHPAQREAERVFLSKWRDVNARDRKWRDADVRYRMRSAVPNDIPWATIPSPRGPKRAPSRSLKYLEECDRTQNDFLRTYGRLPTTEECLKLWPHLWKP
jgi:hypothetical protein